MSPHRSDDDLLLDHEYDGIRELDNRLPGWWLWLFYLTIAFSAAYLAWYHVLGRGMPSATAYEAEMAEARRLGLGLRYEAWGPEVTPLAEPAQLVAGQTVYTRSCAVCHGAAGEGKIGPNLTDDAFLHGQGFPEMVKVIEEGVPAKGMVTWKTQLSRDELRAVASFAWSLRGTSPPNPKAPQGTRY
jgi:cytochrome c oxidase cbb3-type subunit 3